MIESGEATATATVLGMLVKKGVVVFLGRRRQFVMMGFGFSSWPLQLPTFSWDDGFQGNFSLSKT